MGFLDKLFGRSSAPDFTLPRAEELTRTPSGLGYQVVKQGQGKKPGPAETVSVHYAGWLENGKLFDSSYARGQPASFPLNRVIAGWTEGLQLMPEGSTYRFVIPPELGYGRRGAPPAIGPDATLVFLVELLSVG
jgi:FKBP-type peptidyl-prolyl cis-trans isomerase FklB